MYENICTKCNPGVLEGEEKKLTPPEHPPSIYIGETSRSLYERGKEHWRAYHSKQEDSHINKHHLIHHGGVGEPSFPLSPVRFTKTALTRQIMEAVLVQRWGEEKLLNSKAEFNRSKISRLTLGDEEKRILRPGVPPDLGEEGDEKLQGECGEVQDWVEDRTKNRRAQEIRGVTSWERGLFRSPARKRLGEEEPPGPASPAKKPKQKYPLLALDWGVEEHQTLSP